MERKREEKMEGKGVFSEEYILTPPPNFEVCADCVTLLKKPDVFLWGRNITKKGGIRISELI